MEDQSTRRRPPLGIVIALAAIVLSAGSATAWFTWRSLSPPEPTADFPELDIEGEAIPEGFDPPNSEPIEVPGPPEPEVAINPAPETSTLYWLSIDGTTVALNPVTVAVPADASAADALQVAFANLMDGPAGEGAASGIPEETELLALVIEADGVHVDLSEDFTFGGGSASMIGRLAQVVYTATALEPSAPVWIDVEGEPLTLLGGEGLEVRQPITRADVATDFGVAAPPVAQE
ncbi:MAG: GerMN domain-containing protein [Cyanobacteria bacterium P01_C01_bin.70]